MKNEVQGVKGQIEDTGTRLGSLGHSSVQETCSTMAKPIDHNKEGTSVYLTEERDICLREAVCLENKNRPLCGLES